ncbi:unnamed protein product [Camellia sinensis]
MHLSASESGIDQNAMEKAIKNKVTKAVVPAIDVMFQALSEFGAKIVPPKRILMMLPELFDHQDQNVRASSKGLTLELCHWIGKEPVKSILFEKMQDTMVPSYIGSYCNSMLLDDIRDLIWTCLVIWRANGSSFCVFVHITLHIFWLRCKFYIFVCITGHVG